MICMRGFYSVPVRTSAVRPLSGELGHLGDQKVPWFLGFAKYPSEVLKWRLHPEPSKGYCWGYSKSPIPAT